MEHSSRELASLGGEDRFTEGELFALRHAMDAEMLCVKKCLHYAQETGDADAVHLFEELADRHHRRIDMMLNLLDAPGSVTKHAKLLLQNAASEQGGLHNA